MARLTDPGLQELQARLSETMGKLGQKEGRYAQFTNTGNQPRAPQEVYVVFNPAELPQATKFGLGLT